MPRSTSPIPRQESSHERSAPSTGRLASTRARFQRDAAQAAEAVGHGWRARALAVLEQLLAMPREFTAVTAT